MSIATVETIVTRIKTAEEDSPIAVFDMGGVLNASFYNTVETRRWIKEKVWPLVGVYHNGVDVKRMTSFFNELVSQS